jgi:hypothetical protein
VNAPPFTPHPLSVGGHRQTLLGWWLRRRLGFPLPVEDVTVDAGDGVRLLCRASWQPGPRDASPALVLIHGLSSSDAAGYVLSTGRLAYARGWHVVRMNLRGAGDSEALCPLLYNSGVDGDVQAVLAALARDVPRLALVGFSLGANLTLLCVSRSAARLPDACAAAVAVSPPVDLQACATALDAARNRVYQRNFLRELCASYRSRQRRLPGAFEAGREVGVRSIREYDERITAPYGGYRDAADYYARASSGPHLAQVARPTLLLAGLDDPLIPGDSVRACLPASSGLLHIELHATGGHVGFVAPSAAPGRFWAGERALAFLAPLAFG